RSTHAQSLPAEHAPRAESRGLDELHETLAAAVEDTTTHDRTERQHDDSRPDAHPESRGVVSIVGDHGHDEQPDGRRAHRDRGDERDGGGVSPTGCRTLRLLERTVARA